MKRAGVDSIIRLAIGADESGDGRSQQDTNTRPGHGFGMGIDVQVVGTLIVPGHRHLALKGFWCKTAR